MRTVLPEKWCIECTEENQDILSEYRLSIATSHKNQLKIPTGYTLLSKHYDDGSCYYANRATTIIGFREYKDYEIITFEEFKILVLNAPLLTPTYEIY